MESIFYFMERIFVNRCLGTRLLPLERISLSNFRCPWYGKGPYLAFSSCLHFPVIHLSANVRLSMCPYAYCLCFSVQNCVTSELRVELGGRRCVFHTSAPDKQKSKVKGGPQGCRSVHSVLAWHRGSAGFSP